MEHSEIAKLFEENYALIRKAYVLDYDAINAICAVMCVAKGKLLTKDEIEEAKEVLKENSGAFSVFRDTMRVPMITKMALSGNPKEYFEGVSNVYRQIQTHFAFGSEQALMAAVTLYDNGKEADMFKLPDETFKVYEMMRENHPFLTYKDDLPIAAFLAIQGGNYDDTFAYMEDCYDILAQRFKLSRDAIQSVAQVFALVKNISPEEKCERFNRYYDALKANKLKIWAGPQLAVLGILVNLGADIDEVIECTEEYDKFLKKQKGFTLGVESQARRVIAIALYLMEKYANKGTSDVALSSILTLIIEFEITLMIIIISSSTAAAAASSSH